MKSTTLNSWFYKIVNQYCRLAKPTTKKIVSLIELSLANYVYYKFTNNFDNVIMRTTNATAHTHDLVFRKIDYKRTTYIDFSIKNHKDHKISATRFISSSIVDYTLSESVLEDAKNQFNDQVFFDILSGMLNGDIDKSNGYGNKFFFNKARDSFLNDAEKDACVFIDTRFMYKIFYSYLRSIEECMREFYMYNQYNLRKTIGFADFAKSGVVTTSKDFSNLITEAIGANYDV